MIVLVFPPCRKDLFGAILKRLERDHDTREARGGGRFVSEGARNLAGLKEYLHILIRCASSTKDSSTHAKSERWFSPAVLTSWDNLNHGDVQQRD